MAEVIDSEVRTYVRELIARVLGVAPGTIDDGMSLTELGIDSVELIDIIVKLESRYAARFDPGKMQELTCRTLSDNVLACVGEE